MKQKQPLPSLGLELSNRLSQNLKKLKRLPELVFAYSNLKKKKEMSNKRIHLEDVSSFLIDAGPDAPHMELTQIDHFCSIEGFRRVPTEEGLGRVYYYPETFEKPAVKVIVQGVRWLKAFTRPQGDDSHLLVLNDGKSVYISPGWIAISWVSSPPFIPSAGYIPIDESND